VNAQDCPSPPAGMSSLTRLDIAAGRGPSWLDEWLSSNGADLVAWRRHIHARPELAYHEQNTTALITEHLRSAGLRPMLLPTGTGLICDIGSGSRCVALHADIDALPLSETTGLPFASTVEGVAHACGHDAAPHGDPDRRSACPGIRPGAARADPAHLPTGRGDDTRWRARCARGRGPVRGGAHLCAALRPRLPFARVDTRIGAITSASDLLELRLSSSGGHTSRLHRTADLVHALGTVITGLPTPLSRWVDPRSGHRARLGRHASRPSRQHRPTARTPLAPCAPETATPGPISNCWPGS
jgi:hypothetical protein